MVEQYEYAYRVWKCKLDDTLCDLDGACDRCYWAKLNREWEALKAQEDKDRAEAKERGEDDG